MNIKSHRENIIQATVLSFILALFLLLVGYSILFITEVEDIISISMVFKLFKTKPLIVLLSSFIIILPLATFFIFRMFSIRLVNREDELINVQGNINKTTNFISHLIREDFETEFEFDEDDKLGKSLLDLRDTLNTNKENATQRRKEDDIRNWTAEGLAKFGEILRRDNDNLSKLAYNVIKNLSDYIGAIQGGFYLLQNAEGKDKHFELMSFYAYGRKKYADKRIKWGKGIIGTSAIERKTIYVTDLPNSYITVTSGLGKANPRSLIVAPLIANNELFGVLEIASLNELGKEHILFVEEVAKSTASILSTVRMNMQTARLLEESNAQSQTLASQEEEMRQNMEELQATQEEAARQSDRFIKLETTVNHTMLRAEYDMDGTMIYANTLFLHKLEYTSNSEIEGKHISMFISKKDEEWFNKIWSGLTEGGRHFEGYMKHVTKSSKDLWTMATYTCIRDENDVAERVLFLGLDNTEQKKQSLNLEGVVDAVNRVSIKIIFDINGNIKEHNESFLYLFKYSEKDVKSLSIFELIDSLEIDLFTKKWENIVRGMNFQGQFKVKTKQDEEIWVHGAFCAIFNMYNEVESVIFIGNDITNEKLMEMESKNQNEILKSQESQLRETEKDLNKKLREAKSDMKAHYKDIEHKMLRNERALDSSTDAVITTSDDNKIIYCNKAATIMLGYSREELINNDVALLFDTSQTRENQFVSTYLTGKNKLVGERNEAKMKSKSGSTIQVLILLSKAQVEKEISYTAFIQTT